MKDNVVVSILCLTYNQKEYIKQALDSFLSQKTDFEYEIVIHDDASTDGTVEIIKEYQRRYPNKIKTILQKTNQYSRGVRGFVVKFLLPIARGKYLATCEGDDYFTDERKLQLQVDFLEKHPDCTLCIHDTRVFYEAGERPDAIIPSFDYENFIPVEELLKLNFIQTSSVMYRRIDYSKFTKTTVFPSDYYLHLYHASFGKIGYIKRTMSDYRRHAGGVWFNNQKRPEKIYENFGFLYTTMYDEAMRLYSGRSESEKIIHGKINALLKNIFNLDLKGNNNELIKNLYSKYPQHVKDFLVELSKVDMTDNERNNVEIVRQLQENSVLLLPLKLKQAISRLKDHLFFKTMK